MATTMETLTGGSASAVGPQAKKQFQALFDVIPFTFSIEEDQLAASAAGTVDITVPGAALGDFVLVAVKLDLVSLELSAFVSAANTVTLVLQNLEVSDVNTTLATAKSGNGIILKPSANTWSAPAG